MKKNQNYLHYGSKHGIDAALLAEMMRSGMDLARFNFSHGCHEDHARRVELVRKAAAEVENQ